MEKTWVNHDKPLVWPSRLDFVTVSRVKGMESNPESSQSPKTTLSRRPDRVNQVCWKCGLTLANHKERDANQGARFIFRHLQSIE